jgi:hypothetical protein
MEIEFIIVSAAITIVSLILLLVTVHSYRIYRNTKLWFVIMVFLFFLIRGLLLSCALLYQPLAPMLSSYYLWIIDLVILTLLYVAALKR